MTILVCNCNHDAACLMHAHDLYWRAEEANYAAEQQALANAGRDFYIPGWTPEDEDRRMGDRLLLDGMEG